MLKNIYKLVQKEDCKVDLNSHNDFDFETTVGYCMISNLVAFDFEHKQCHRSDSCMVPSFHETHSDSDMKHLSRCYTDANSLETYSDFDNNNCKEGNFRDKLLVVHI